MTSLSLLHFTFGYTVCSVDKSRHCIKLCRVALSLNCSLALMLMSRNGKKNKLVLLLLTLEPKMQEKRIKLVKFCIILLLGEGNEPHIDEFSDLSVCTLYMLYLA